MGSSNENVITKSDQLSGSLVSKGISMPKQGDT